MAQNSSTNNIFQQVEGALVTLKDQVADLTGRNDQLSNELKRSRVRLTAMEKEYHTQGANFEKKAKKMRSDHAGAMHVVQNDLIFWKAKAKEYQDQAAKNVDAINKLKKQVEKSTNDLAIADQKSRDLVVQRDEAHRVAAEAAKILMPFLEQTTRGVRHRS